MTKQLKRMDNPTIVREALMFPLKGRQNRLNQNSVKPHNTGCSLHQNGIDFHNHRARVLSSWSLLGGKNLSLGFCCPSDGLFGSRFCFFLVGDNRLVMLIVRRRGLLNSAIWQTVFTLLTTLILRPNLSHAVPIIYGIRQLTEISPS